MTRPSEDDLIARYLAPLAGPGALGLRDDAGLATPRPGCDLVVSKDMLVAGVHFFADDPPDAIARKALRVNLSDLAAKGATPLGFLLGLALPSDWTEPWLAAFCAGLSGDARAYGCPLVGGDTTATPGPLTLSITVFGEVPVGRMVPRTGVRADDRLYVTGTIGDAALGLRIRLAASEDATWIASLDEGSTATLLHRYLHPEPRMAFRQALSRARAAMDVSDGFVGDLEKMLRLEHLTTSIDADSVPTSSAVDAALKLAPHLIKTVLMGGDDYEIVCAVAPIDDAAFSSAAQAACVRVTFVGIARPGTSAVNVRSHDRKPLALGRSRFDHFSPKRSRTTEV